MTDINNLIHLNVELEGLLRVLTQRKSIHAKSLLAQKYREYVSQVEAFLAEPDEDNAAEVADAAADLARDANYVEVKTEEAVSGEVEDETDAATAAIERGAAEAAEPAAGLAAIEATATESFPQAVPSETNTRLLRAFTLNDKFRFTRELFHGDDRGFNDTLEILADMPSYEDACDFIYDDMTFDPQNSDVAAFMAILSDNMPHKA